MISQDIAHKPLSQHFNQEYLSKQENLESKVGVPDFSKLLEASNEEKQKELSALKQESGGELHLGETKTDKEFREMLEKVTGKKQEKSKGALDKDDYLNLLVTQLQNQDPTKPIEHQQMASELAQFNTVEQLLAINKQLTDMNTLQQKSQSDRLLNFIGKEVEIKGNNLKLNSNNVENRGLFSLKSPSQMTTGIIKNAKGEQIKTLDLGALSPGKHELIWDGTDNKNSKVPSGEYSFSIQASAKDGKDIQVGDLSYSALVESISEINTGGKLSTKMGDFSLDDVLTIKAQKPVTHEPGNDVLLNHQASHSKGPKLNRTHEGELRDFHQGGGSSNNKPNA